MEEVRSAISALVEGRKVPGGEVDFLEAYDLFLETYRATRNKIIVLKYQTILGHLLQIQIPGIYSHLPNSPDSDR